MLRTYASQPCRLASVASSSSSTFHTSAVLSKISEARLRSRAVEKANLEKRDQRTRILEETRPSVVLGTRPGEENKWRDCYLANLLVDESVFTKSPNYGPSLPEYGGAILPEYKAFGVTGAVEQKLFRDLRQLSASLHPKDGDKIEQDKSNNFARVIDLRNSDAGGIGYENRRRIIAGFSTPENPFDPGRTEVQAAILTYRIRKLYAHLTRCKHDLQNKLSLRKLVHQRAKVLKYLKRTQRVRYDNLLEKLAVEPEAVEGELRA
ncbi:hypothetical protein DFH07DRAFT_926057 [Mycena maculata]|uniref:Mitochondrial ribosomal protein S15 n=1 Tax=Mycena maculata TaxID=230809 RepID=A0AAD7N1E3_9AGAR|nr:hypothetical protein DFH07DRAFT_926057 [Mycena maculata]